MLLDNGLNISDIRQANSMSERLVEQIVNEHQLPLSKAKKGQILWQAVAKDENLKEKKKRIHA